MRRLLVLLAVIALLAPATAGATVRNYRVDAGHTGEIPTASLSAPIGRKWIRRDIKASGEPLVADGRVFVQRDDARNVTALERDTGATLWERSGPVNGFAYADGVLFYSTVGSVEAVDAATGRVRWSKALTGRFHGKPVYDGGTLYVGTEGAAVALRASDGFELWRADAYGAESVLGVDAERVYSVSGCDAATALERRVGLQMWRYVGDCVGRGGAAPMIADGLLYSGDEVGGVILEASSGDRKGTIRGAPTRAGDLVLLAQDRSLAAQDRQGRIVWRATREAAGASSLPLVVGSVAWQRVGNQLVGYDVKTGAKVHETGGVSDGTESYSDSYAQLGSDGEWLVFAGTGRVVGLTNGGDTPGIDDPDLPKGQETEVTITADKRVFKPYDSAITLRADARRGGYSVAPPDELRVEQDPYPYDDRWEPIARDPNGLHTVVPRVNTRYRAVNVTTAPQVVSAPVEVRTEFETALQLKALSRRTVLATAQADAPPGLSLARRPVYFYRLRRGQKLATRIRVVRWRATGRPQRFRASIRLRAASLRRTDRIFFCFRNPLPNAVGKPVRGTDPCGRRRA